MIVKFARTLASANAAIDYVENEDHISDVVATSRGLPLEQRGQASGLAALRPTGTDALDALIAYADDSEKTLTRHRQIGDEAKAAMRFRGQLKPKVKDAWQHIIISYHPGDRPKITDADLAADAKALVMALADGENHWRQQRGRQSRVDGESLLWIATTHREKRHLHTHLILCRVDAYGQVLSNSGHRNVESARRLCGKIEEERGLVRTKGWDPDEGSGGGDRNPNAWYHRGEFAPEQGELADEIADIADASADRADLARRLDERGLRLEKVTNGRGYNLIDSAGTSVQASRYGLVGRRNPDRLGLPLSSKATARTDLWEAAAESSDWSSFTAALRKRGLRADVTEQGVLQRIQRLDPISGAPLKGAHWSPRELGFQRPPRQGDSVWWQRRQEQAAKFGERGRPSTRRASTRGNQKASQQGQTKTDRTTGVILLPAKGKSWHDALVDLAATREALAAKIAARDRDAKLVKEVSHAPVTHAVVDQTAAAPTTREPTAADRAAFDRDVQFVQKSLASLRRESDLATQRRLLSSRGISLSYDQRTASWYASRDGSIAAVPGLSGVADDGKGGKLAEVRGPTITDAKPKVDPPSVPGAKVAWKAVPKPRLPDRDDRRRLPDWGP